MSKTGSLAQPTQWAAFWRSTVRGSLSRAGMPCAVFGAAELSPIVVYAQQPASVTFAGAEFFPTIPAGFNPDAVARDNAGNIFIANASTVIGLPTGGGAPIPIATGLNGPRGIAVGGAGGVFVADTGNNRALEIKTDQTQVILTAPGQLNDPFGIAVDAAGDVFVADTGNNRVVEIVPGAANLSKVGGGLSTPTGVAVDTSGNLFIADFDNNRVLKVDISSGTFTPLGTEFLDLQAVAVGPNGIPYVIDFKQNAAVSTLYWIPAVNQTKTLEQFDSATAFVSALVIDDSAQFGSSFTYTQQFIWSGPATAVGGVGATLTNTIGTSPEVTSP